MKVTVPTLEIGKACTRLLSIVPARPAIPILSNVLVEAKDNTLTLSVTDLTVSLRLTLNAQVLEPGSITLPARRLTQLVRELTSTHVEIECAAGDIAHIRSGNALFRLNGIHKSEYPTLPDMTGGNSISVSPPQLAQLLTKVSFAAAKEDSRHVLNGIHMELEGSMLTFTGTDGKRLAKIKAEVGVSGELDGTYLIPLKGVEEVIRILDEQQSIQFYVSPDKICIEGEDRMLIAKLLSGEFPNVDRVIPQSPSKNITLHREELLILLKQVSLFTTEMNHSVRFHFENGELTLTAMSSEIGEGKVSMPVNYSDEPFDVAFNPFYFADILRHCKDETITFGINDAFNPGKISDTSEATFVLMPMRLTAAASTTAA